MYINIKISCFSILISRKEPIGQFYIHFNWQKITGLFYELVTVLPGVKRGRKKKKVILTYIFLLRTFLQYSRYLLTKEILHYHNSLSSASSYVKSLLIMLLLTPSSSSIHCSLGFPLLLLHWHSTPISFWNIVTAHPLQMSKPFQSSFCYYLSNVVLKLHIKKNV